MEQLSGQLSSWPISLQAIAGALILGLVYHVVTGNRPYAGFPVVKPDEKGFFTPLKLSWMFNAKGMLAKGKEMTNNGFFQVRKIYINFSMQC